MGGNTVANFPAPSRNGRPPLLLLVVVGLGAGLLSGVFGIGGGTMIVPALVLWLGVEQKTATGTSVASILPAAIVGTLTYGLRGDVDWLAAAGLATGILMGAQAGSWALARIRVSAIQWGFMVFLLVVIVSLWFVVPGRSDVMSLGAGQLVGLVVLGVVIGTVGGIVGVGGGVIMVPILMFFFGASDLIAKGTSLAMLIPGSISGTVGNLRRRNVDLVAAAVIGLVACVCVPLGVIIANALEPLWANIAFSVFLAIILAQMLVRRIKADRLGREG